MFMDYGTAVCLFSAGSCSSSSVLVYFLLVSCAALLVRPGVYRTARRPHLASGVCALAVGLPSPHPL